MKYNYETFYKIFVTYFLNEFLDSRKIILTLFIFIINEINA